MSRSQFFSLAALIFAAPQLSREGALAACAVALVIAFILQRRGG